MWQKHNQVAFEEEKILKNNDSMGIRAENAMNTKGIGGISRKFLTFAKITLLMMMLRQLK